MLVLSVAYPLFPVSADSSGGAEQILYLLERGLVQAGHQSIVVAARGSQISGMLVPTEPAGPVITESDRSRGQQEHRRQLETILQCEPVDLVHFHGLDFNSYLPPTKVPAVVTLHLPPSWYKPEVFSLPDIHFVCVSQTQAATVPDASVTVIENGVESPGEPVDHPRSQELLWIGRICPEKGTHIAVRVAQTLGLPLIVAGPVHGFSSHLAYFKTEVEPLLDEHRRYIGPVNKLEKTQLLQRARALLVPTLAPETSSLVAMEAISAGTPVVAFASGALPEVVEHGVSGYIVHSEEEMADALSRLDQLSQQPHHFPVESMVTKYLAFYERVISSRHFPIGSAPHEAL